MKKLKDIILKKKLDGTDDFKGIYRPFSARLK